MAIIQKEVYFENITGEQFSREAEKINCAKDMYTFASERHRMGLRDKKGFELWSGWIYYKVDENALKSIEKATGKVVKELKIKI